MSWPRMRGRYLFREVNERGFDLPLASVTRDGGVEFRSDLDIAVWSPADNTSQYKRVRPYDFVIGLRSFQSGIGYSTLEGLVSPAYTVLRPISSKVHGGFFKYLFKSDFYISRLDNVSQGIRQGRTISTEDFYNIPIAIPPVPEQRTIARYLDTETARIDALISKKRRIIELLEEQGRRTIDDLFVDVLNSRLTRLGYVADVRSGVTLGGFRPRTTSNVTVPYLRVANVQHDRLDLREVKTVTVDWATAQRTMLRNGDVLMTEGGDIDKLGRGTVWRGEINPCLHQNHVFAVRARTRDLLPDFLALVTRTSHARRYFEMTGARSTNLASTNSSKVADFRIPFPSLSVQSELVHRYQTRKDTVTSIRTALLRQLEVLSERRQALVTTVTAGEMLVRTATEAVTTTGFIRS